jgi:hypothetical protein
MPQGIQQVEINPKTGEAATPEDTDKRVELFLNGTGPSSGSEEVPEEEATPEVQPIPTPQESPPSPIIEPSPLPSPRVRNDSRILPQEGSRLEGTITLDIDPSTGLIAVETCPVVRTKTFVLGTEPRKYCGPEYHRSKTVDPSQSRPRTVATPIPQR